jgi:hypothetical protein
VKAGSGAVRVVVGRGAPVVLAGAVLAGARAAEVWVAVLAPGLVPAGTEGVPATDTVLVDDPHPPRSAPREIPNRSTVTAGRLDLTVSMVFVASPCTPRSPDARVTMGRSS